MSVEYCLRTADDEVDIWLLKVDKPIEVFNRLLEKAGEEASEQNRPGDVVLHVEEGLDRFTIYYVYGRRESFMLTALLAREGVELQVNAKDMLAEELANLILKSTLNLELPKLTEEEKKHKTLEFRERLNREERLKKIKNSITDFDLKVLELRSRGYSLLGIALELGATISKIRYSLQKLAQIPEYRNKLGKYTPKPRRKS